MWNRFVAVLVTTLAVAIVGCESDCFDNLENFGCVDGNLPLTYVSHSLEGHALTINVTYPGGCGQHHFAAWWNGRTLTTVPGIAQIELHHYSCGENCGDTVTDAVTINLSALDNAAGPAPQILRVEVFQAAGYILVPQFDYSVPAESSPPPQDSIDIIGDCGGIDIP
jgi:hypothetical protein